MKDAILEILLDKVKATAHDFYPTGIEGLPQSARDIAELMAAFIKWLSYENHPFVPWWDVIDGKRIDYFTDEINPKKWSIDELFTYWYDNVYKKQ